MECPPCCLRDHEEYTVTEGMTFKTVIFVRKCISRSQGKTEHPIDSLARKRSAEPR